MPAPNLQLVAFTDSTIGIYVGNTDDPGPSTITLELNRARDFASDVSMFVTLPDYPNGVTGVTILGLPSDTTWYVRGRSSTGPAYSNIVCGTTDPVPVPPYPGYSIDKALLVIPADIYDLHINGLTSGGPRPGFPIVNLLSDDPQATFQLTTGPGVGFGVSMSWTTSGEAIDTVAVLGTLFGDDAVMELRSSPNPNDFAVAGATFQGSTFRCSPGAGRRPSYHGLFTLDQPTRNRAWNIYIHTAAPFMLMRNLVTGLARQSVNASKGSGAVTNDLGSAARTRFGTLDRVSGWRGRTVDFQLSWLDETEFHTKWADLPWRVGKTRSVLAIPNAKRNVWLNDRIAFGPITDARAENVATSKFQQNLTIDSIY